MIIRRYDAVGEHRDIAGYGRACRCAYGRSEDAIRQPALDNRRPRRSLLNLHMGWVGFAPAGRA